MLPMNTNEITDVVVSTLEGLAKDKLGDGAEGWIEALGTLLSAGAKSVISEALTTRMEASDVVFVDFKD